MTDPVRLVGIVGSLRAQSFSRIVFEAAAELIGPQAELTEVAIRDVPLYDGDVEVAGDPPSVTNLKESVDGADGLIVFSPEYNRGTPAITKNAIDWLSRMPRQSVLTRAAVGVVATTVGSHEAAGVRRHLADSIGANTKRFYATTLGFGSIADKVADGRLSDPETRSTLEMWLAGFVAHVLAHQSARHEESASD